MTVFLDTTQNNFVACLFKENYLVEKYSIIKTQRKVEEITFFFNELLINKKMQIKDIESFYINIGPGSFTGSRISLVYVRTIAQITGAKIFITNSFKLLQKNNNELFVYANKNHSFKIGLKDIDNLTKTLLVDKSDQESEIDYKNILFSFKESLNLFKEEDLLKIKPEYGSMPQIGNKK